MHAKDPDSLKMIFLFFIKISFFVSSRKVDGLCYLLQEIYGIENKINQKSSKVSVSVHDSCHVGVTHLPRLQCSQGSVLLPSC